MGGGEEGVVSNTLTAAATGLVSGLFVGSLKSAWEGPAASAAHKTKMVSVTMNHLRFNAGLFALVGASYALAEGITATILEEQGPKSTVVGSIAAGTVVGMSRKSLRACFGFSLAFSGVLLFADANGLSLTQKSVRDWNKMRPYAVTEESH
mmetsp:Transcript_11403/g.13071  ORF Transcript_11403/g.13071 Transcript_11403/m.13071 type:complete len:151 (-) Transcript_11403:149-601(-)|eukprot:CAMPEP_0184022236 /NCGR_PEP_ID=MMETSP0954-20121128/10480_1 /TAXON_ID=627963 /ORGANISM="Aplanochytrium sp, Strain PBS07" /LENGTH=150 /DNA_ID=CAMNT_0026304561 /DNA_START=261 /DNA_END=713 /DNA_ORIENTATION=+